MNKVDLRPLCPPVYDQGQLGSCSGNAIAAAYEFDMMRQKEVSFIPSRLFIYYNERAAEGKINSDSGAFIDDGIVSIDTNGVCSEKTWPYDITKFEVKPSDEAYAEAKRHTAIKCYNTPVDITDIKNALDSGFPVIVGIQLFNSFESPFVAKNGHVPMPLPTDVSIGGHCVLIVGYDDVLKILTVRNSWGVDWGDKGYFYLPYDYVVDSLMSDLWSIEVIV